MTTLIDDIRENVSLTWKYRTPLDSTVLGPQLRGAVNPGLICVPSYSIDGVSLTFNKLQCYLIPWSSSETILAQHQNALVRLELETTFSLFFNEESYGALTLQMVWQDLADPLVRLNFVPITELNGRTTNDDPTHQIVLGYLASDQVSLKYNPYHGDYTTQCQYETYSRCDFLRPISLREAKLASVTSAAVLRTLSHSNLYGAQVPAFLKVIAPASTLPAASTYQVDTPSSHYTFTSIDSDLKYLIGYQKGVNSLTVLQTYSGSSLTLPDTRDFYPIAEVQFESGATDVSKTSSIRYFMDSGLDFSRDVDILGTLHSRGLI